MGKKPFILCISKGTNLNMDVHTAKTKEYIDAKSDIVLMLAISASWKSFRGMKANIFLFHFAITCGFASHCFLCP